MPERDANDSTSRSPVRLIARLVVIAFILGLAIWGFVYWVSREHAPSAVEAAPPPALDVLVMEVRLQNVPIEPQFLGVTQASQVVEIRVRVNGFIDEQAFVEGGRVERGQLLYRLDAQPFEAELAVARARLENAQARLERAQRQVERLRQAAAGGAVAAAELDQWETEARVANADVQLAQAQVTQAELELGYTEIRSPITGVIGQSERDVGSYVQAGEQGRLATVQQIDPIYVEYSVSEQELLRWQRMIREGQVQVPPADQLPLSLELADGSRFPLLGFVNFFDVQINPTTGTAQARGEVPNPEHLLRPGQLVRVHIGGIQRLNVVLVPQQAVLDSPGGAFVYVVNAMNMAEQRIVQLGEWYGDAWVILGGLNAGDLVIVDRLIMIRPGMPVRVASIIPPPATQPTTQPATQPTTQPRTQPSTAPGGSPQ